MKDKEKLSMYVDIIKITIIICWVSLIAFWLLKIFGGNLFEIMVENENFLKFSELVQNSWLKYLVSFFTIGIAKYFTFGAICQKFYFKGKQLVFVILSIISIWAVSNFVPMGKLQFPAWYAYVLFIVASVIYQNGWKKTFGILAIIFETVFSVISFLIRNVPLYVTNNYFIASILIIDMYIMTVLYYLYANIIEIKKGENL